MLKPREALLVALCCAWVTSLSGDTFPDNPKFVSEGGHLVISTPQGKNISFRTGSGRGGILFNGEDVATMLETVKNAHTKLTPFLGPEQAGALFTVVPTVQNLQSQVFDLTNKTDLLRRDVSSIKGRRLRNLLNSVSSLNSRISQLNTLLRRDECSSNPCQHGGTCIDLFNKYQCLCRDNWEGDQCDQDVDECIRYAQTGLGCQNGGTCVNTLGGYQCRCPAAYHGVHCTEQHDDCALSSSQALCGHGTCISRKNQSGQALGYSCICDQGWTKRPSGDDPACTEDVDECSTGRHFCSRQPLAQCVNYPGGFTCGPCPAGYSGDGFTCVDIDECLVNNGGCSLNPRVDCINTVGSRTCGPCPPGYAGDGVRCNFVGLCYSNNGGCSANAICIDHSGTFRECRCPAGFVGLGIGPAGCLPAPNSTAPMQPVGPTLRDPCSPNPCQHGFCLPTSTLSGQTTFHCSCSGGYTGPLCDAILDVCNSSPCENNGTCVNRVDGYQCSCTAEWTGTNCEHPRQDCGGTLGGENGTLVYPLTADSYAHRRHCVWHIETSLGMVLNLTFTKFDLEQGHECAFDFLEIHDGETLTSPLFGRYCGTDLLGRNITTTHHSVTLWFKTDHSVSGEGFALNWTSVPPVCGEDLAQADVGTVKSPGYPGNYPSKRDCFWTVRVPAGKRIQFHFATLQLEEHDSCEYDYLKIYDGTTERSQVLGSYCSTGTPPPVTTTAHLALLHFHSDDSQTDTGFHLTYASVPGIPGCGGLLTAARGLFTSPDYPETYGSNRLCEWEIRVTMNEKVEITFEDFELESGRSCRWDYLEIFDGPDDSSELKGRFCGSTAPQPIKSSSNRMFVRFRTDASQAHRGFKARYIAACGGRYTDINGTLTSPGYPNEYQGNRNCNYSIEVPLNNVIQLTFQLLDMEESGHCHFDYIRVWEPSMNGTNELARLCGRTPPDPIISTMNHLYLTFRSDHSVHKQGFYANYTIVPTDCGGVLTEPGTIQSPGTQTGQYQHNSRCNWILRAPPGFVVRLVFTQFILEASNDCKYDYVQLMDSSRHTIGRFCGTDIPAGDFTSTGDTLFVTFQTDANVAHDGFLATFDFMNASTVCGGNFFLPEGVIRTPGFPQSYPPRRSCTWILHAPEGQQIRLNFTAFDLEGPPCRYDYLEIRNGADPGAPIAGQYCARQPPQGFISYTNVLRLRFFSDDSVFGSGFEIAYDTALTGCGGVASGTSGHITSPNYPQPYGHNADCSWTIMASQGSIISIVIVDVDIEQHTTCKYDFLELYDGPSRTSRRLARLCSAPQMAIHYQSTGPVVFAMFRTDSSAAGRGFHIAYTSNCNNVIKNKRRGVIESPNFPNSYAHNYNCTWTIQAPLGHNVSIAFSHFQLETHDNCIFDYVEINESRSTDHDGPSNDHRMIARLCGSHLPSVIVSTGNIVTVRFVTDQTDNAEGFRLEYAWQGCSGEVRKPHGTIESPNYPNGYPANTECIWTIVTMPGTLVELTFRDFHIESSSGCSFDFVRVYGGPEITSPLITEMCEGGSSSQVVTSTGNTMTIHFRSDSTISGKGFRATYDSRMGGCGGRFSTASSTTITSPNYPSNYDTHDDCMWWLKTDQGHTVALTFLDTDIPQSTNCSQSSLTVKDYVNGYWTPVLKHCGSSLPDAPVIRSTGNKLLVHLKGDGSSAGRGFKANFTQGCGATVNVDTPGAITSFNYPNIGTSPAATNCSWLLTTNVTNERVSLRITHIDVFRECLHVNVTIRNGPNPDSPIMDTLCTRSIPPTFTSTGPAMYVQAYSAIFRAVYSAFTASCGGTLTGEHGYFASSGYPYSYPNSQDCVWSMRASAGNFFEISLLELDIEESEFCAKDYLEIRETDSGGRLLGRFCGSQVPANFTQASGFWFKFHSDEDGAGTGFKIEFALARDVNLEGESGLVESPGYPQNTFMSGRITWTVRVPLGLFPRITFDSFYIVPDHCETGSIQIFDGGDAEPLRVGQYCGSDTIEPLRLRTSLAVVRYQSKRAVASFKLRWEAVNDTYFPGTTQETTGTLCKTTILLHNATETTNITSRGYPRAYEENINCTYIVMAPAKRRVSFKFDAVSLTSTEGSWHCYYDTVHVFDVTPWTNDKPQELLVTCGAPSSLPPAVSGSGQSLRVTFVTSLNFGHARGSGFTATVSSVCGGNITAPSGALEDSDLLPSEIDCKWLINPERRRKLKLTLQMYDNPSGDQVCRDNYIKILNGGYEDSPALGQGTFCGSSASDVSLPETTSDKVFVIYRTSRGGMRFKLRWEEAMPECGGRIRLTAESPEHEFHSPGYPHQGPPHSIECTWLLQAPPGKKILLDFPSALHMKDGCRNKEDMTDFVRVLDGGTEVAHPLGVFCGSERVMTVKSTGNLLLVQFVQTGNGDNYAGFTATARIGACGGIVWGPGLQELRQKLRSREAFDCEWQLIGPIPETPVRFIVNYLTLPESPGCTGDDYFEVRDTNASGPVLARVCGANQSIDATPTEDKLYVHVKTRGAPIQSPLFTLQLFIVRRPCRGTLSASEGDIETPGFPEPMAARTVCRWALSASPGRRLTVNFHEGDISNCESTLTITEGSLVVKVPCNTSFPYVYESFSQRIMIAILAPRRSTVHGFRAHYDSDKELPCQYSPEEPSGLLVPAAEVLQARPSMCSWTFDLDSNVTLSYTLTGVNTTVANTHCKEEYIRGNEILCERGKQGRSLARFRHLSLGYVKKHSQPSGGINVTYKINECGGIVKVRETPSFYTSPAFPDQYTRNADCMWTLEPVVWNAQVEMNFTSFQLEDDCSKDYVEITSGAHPRSPSIDKYCGSRRPPYLRGNVFTVIFHSDGDGAAPGFNFTVSLSGLPCGGFRHIRGLTTLETPNHPSAYPSNTECDWVLDGQRGHRINITFSGRFDVQQSTSCTRDYVEIFNEVDGSWTSPLKYCGLTNPPSFVSTSHRARLLFRSDGTMQGDGFQATVTLACGDNYTEPAGEISSPRYPDPYEANLQCDYLIFVPQGSHVEITFNPQFEIEAFWDNCRYDSLTIYEGTTDSSRQLVRACGVEAPGNLTISSSVLIRFKSDWSVPGKGFSLQYRVLACGGNLTGPIGTFGIEPGAAQAECVWYISVDPGQAVEIRFLSLRGGWGVSEGGCYYSQIGSGIVVYDGNKTRSQPLYAYCGLVNQSPIAITSSNSAVVVVENRHNQNRNSIGFRALYRATLGPRQGCGGTLRIGDTNRVNIRWPQADGTQYPADVNCIWRVLGSPGKVLRVNLTEFQLQQNDSSCSSDFVEVWDTLRTRDLSRQRFCGSVVPPTIPMAGNIVSLRFSSDHLVSGTGFKVVVAQEDPLCGGELTLGTTAQTLSSPGFPSGAPAGTRCVWNMPDTAVIHFTSFHIPCESGASLIILPVLGNEKSTQLCGDSVPHQYHTVQTHHMDTRRHIVFSAGSAAQEARFQFNYKQPTSENRTYTSDSGIVMSYAYPGASRLERLPLIINISPTTRGGTLSLYFLSFNIGTPHTGTCAQTRMEVRDGETTSSRLLATLCGHANPNPLFSTADRVALVVDKGPDSSRWYPYATFQIMYISSTQGSGCGGNITYTEGAFSSPGFPDVLQEAKTCRWYIGVPMRSQIRMRFQAFSLNSTAGCSTNYVEIYEGNTEDDDSFVVRFCGQDHPAPFESRGNKIMVKLVTSGPQPGQGFYAAFRANVQDSLPSQVEYVVGDLS